MTDTATIAFQLQRLLVLDRANLIRRARARLEQRIGAGELSGAEVILGCPPEALRCGSTRLATASCGDQYCFFARIDRRQIASIPARRGA
jgi:hypothetical protein